MALGISASPLSCGNSQVTISATNIQSTPSRWGVFLFYKAVYGSTPFYSGAFAGNLLNPILDTNWTIKLPVNADYGIYAISLLSFDNTITYGLNDWTYNSVDGRIYISIASSNTGNLLDNQVYWRQFNADDRENVPTKYISGNIAAGTIESATIDLNVTGNMTFLGLVPKIEYSCLSSIPTLVLEDNTRNFSIDGNPNGYGGINPYRGDYAQMVILTNTTSAGVFTEYQARPYNYRSSLSYYFDIPKDGVYTAWDFLVQIFGNQPSYNTLDAVFDVATNAFYKSNIDNNADPVTNMVSWTPIATYADFTSVYLYKTQAYYFNQTANGEKMMYDLNQGIKTSCPCIATGGNSKCGGDLLKKYTFVLAMIQSACFARKIGRYNDAQCFLEKIPKNCSPYISAYKC